MTLFSFSCVTWLSDLQIQKKIILSSFLLTKTLGCTQKMRLINGSTKSTLIWIYGLCIACADPGGPALIMLFLVIRGDDGLNSTISRPSSACQRNSLACRWWPSIGCWIGSFVIFQGFRTSIAMKPYIFVIFQGGGGSGPLSPPPSSGSAHALQHMHGRLRGFLWICDKYQKLVCLSKCNNYSVGFSVELFN